ncbi:MAG: hypothetical protein MR051_07975 [Lentisphaeria bacterium]|nr:hypothetical protein [Lentisphaeria bacterium]
MPDQNDRRLELVREFLACGDFDSALDYCDRVLDDDPGDGFAYYWRLLAELECRSEAELTKIPGLSVHRTFLLARRYASPELAAKLAGIIAAQNTAPRRRTVVPRPIKPETAQEQTPAPVALPEPESESAPVEKGKKFRRMFGIAAALLTLAALAATAVMIFVRKPAASPPAADPLELRRSAAKKNGLSWDETATVV